MASRELTRVVSSLTPCWPKQSIPDRINRKGWRPSILCKHKTSAFASEQVWRKGLFDDYAGQGARINLHRMFW